MTSPVVLIGAYYYLGWFASVLLARSAFSWAALLAPLLLIGFLVFKRILRRRELAVGLAAAGGGIVFDSWMANRGLIAVQGQQSSLIPVWLISIWLLFSFSMLIMGRAIRIPTVVASLLGAIAGPLSYKSGEFFEVLTLNSPSAIWLYAGFWSIAFPSILFLAKRVA